jgi:hypothetical protein
LGIYPRRETKMEKKYFTQGSWNSSVEIFFFTKIRMESYFSAVNSRHCSWWR